MAEKKRRVRKRVSVTETIAERVKEAEQTILLMSDEIGKLADQIEGVGKGATDCHDRMLEKLGSALAKVEQHSRSADERSLRARQIYNEFRVALTDHARTIEKMVRDIRRSDAYSVSPSINATNNRIEELSLRIGARLDETNRRILELSQLLAEKRRPLLSRAWNAFWRWWLMEPRENCNRPNRA